MAPGDIDLARQGSPEATTEGNNGDAATGAAGHRRVAACRMGRFVCPSAVYVNRVMCDQEVDSS